MGSVEIRNRKFVKEAVSDGKVRPHSTKKMCFMAAERGLEWEKEQTKAQIPEDPLPSIPDIIRMSQVEFPWLGLAAQQIERKEKRDPSFGGCGLHRCGPKLPLGRERPVLDLVTPPPSPPPKPKEK